MKYADKMALTETKGNKLPGTQVFMLGFQELLE